MSIPAREMRSVEKIRKDIYSEIHQKVQLAISRADALRGSDKKQAIDAEKAELDAYKDLLENINAIALKYHTEILRTKNQKKKHIKLFTSKTKETFSNEIEAVINDYLKAKSKALGLEPSEIRSLVRDIHSYRDAALGERNVVAHEPKFWRENQNLAKELIKRIETSKAKMGAETPATQKETKIKPETKREEKTKREETKREESPNPFEYIDEKVIREVFEQTKPPKEPPITNVSAAGDLALSLAATLAQEPPITIVPVEGDLAITDDLARAYAKAAQSSKLASTSERETEIKNLYEWKRLYEEHQAELEAHERDQKRREENEALRQSDLKIRLEVKNGVEISSSKLAPIEQESREIKPLIESLRTTISAAEIERLRARAPDLIAQIETLSNEAELDAKTIQESAYKIGRELTLHELFALPSLHPTRPKAKQKPEDLGYEFIPLMQAGPFNEEKTRQWQIKMIAILKKCASRLDEILPQLKDSRRQFDDRAATVLKLLQEARERYKTEIKREIDAAETAIGQLDDIVFDQIADILNGDTKRKADETNAFHASPSAGKYADEAQRLATQALEFAHAVQDRDIKIKEEKKGIREALEKAKQAVERGDWAEYEAQWKVAEDARVRASKHLAAAKIALNSALAAKNALPLAHANATEGHVTDTMQKIRTEMERNANDVLGVKNRTEEVVRLVQQLATDATLKGNTVLLMQDPESAAKVTLALEEVRKIQNLVFKVELAAHNARKENKEAKQTLEDAQLLFPNKDLKSLERVQAHAERMHRSSQGAEKQRLEIERLLKLATDTNAALETAYSEARVTYFQAVKKRLEVDEEAILEANQAAIRASSECKQLCDDSRRVVEPADGVFGHGPFSTADVLQHMADAHREVARANQLSAEGENVATLADAERRKAHDERPNVQAAFLKEDVEGLETSIRNIHHARTVAVEAKLRTEALRDQTRPVKEAAIAARDRASVAYMNEVKRRVEEEAAFAKAAAEIAGRYRQEMNGYDAGSRDIVARSVTNYFLPTAASHVQHLREHLQGIDQLVNDALPDFVASENAHAEARQAVIDATAAATAGDLGTLENQYTLAHEARLAAEAARDRGQLQLDQIKRRYAAFNPLVLEAHQAHAFEEIRLKQAGEAARLETIRRQQAQQAEIARQQLQASAEQSKRRQEAAVHDMLVRRGLRNP